MISTRTIAGVALMVAAMAGHAGADEVFLKEGGVLSGRVVNRTEAAVEIEIAAGRMSIPAAIVERIEEGRSVLDEYDDRRKALRPRDRAGWLALARWASGQGLARQARQAYEHVLTIAPNDPEANRALGRVEVDGRWMTVEESYRARGYVPFEGTWVTPEEKNRILRERAEREQLERVLVAADARVRDAEARAREAEMRAAEAEMALSSVTQVEGIPLWWVWGPGPVVWPSGPVVGSTWPRSRYACR